MNWDPYLGNIAACSITSEERRRRVRERVQMWPGAARPFLDEGRVLDRRQPRVKAIQGHQLLVSASFHDASMPEDDDEIRVSDGAESRSDEEAGAAGHQPLEGFLDQPFGAGVDARRLIALGFTEAKAWRCACNGRGPWWNVRSSQTNAAYPAATFQRMGLICLLATVKAYA